MIANTWTCPHCSALNAQPGPVAIAARKVECSACGKTIRLEQPNKTMEASRGDALDRGLQS